MSWISNNYEKAALGGTAAIALGLAYMGWSTFGGVDTEFAAALKGEGGKMTDVKEANLISGTISSMKLDRSWTQAVFNERPVDLFTGIPLFVAAASPDKAVNLLDKGGEMIHSPIPNIWWIEHRLDPGFGDSPSRDPDEDGFTNLEEFNAKTDPNDVKSHPTLIEKLMYVGDETLEWVVLPGYKDEQGAFGFKYYDVNRQTNAKQTNRTGAANPVAPGALFFGAGVMQNRFKLLGSETRREHDNKINIDRDVTMARIEDQKPNKKGTIYEFPAPLNDQRAPDFKKFDRTAILSLEALGEDGQTFKVEENTTFGLPSSSATKNYRVLEITPESIEIERTDADGTKHPFKITKGSKGPQAN